MVREIDGVGPAAVVAGEQRQEDAEDRRDQRRDEADQQRGAPAVHQPHHLVAAEAAVGAEEELAVGAEPERRRSACLLGVDDFALFAVDVELFQRVGRRSARCGRRCRPRAAPPATKTTIRTKRPRKASATRLRSRRRQARRQGLLAAAGAASSALGSEATPHSVKPAPGGYFSSKLVRSVPEGRVEDDVVEVDFAR